jgi:hypothetical protein
VITNIRLFIEFNYKYYPSSEYSLFSLCLIAIYCKSNKLKSKFSNISLINFHFTLFYFFLGDDEDNIDPALRASNVLPMHGSEHNFNMNTLLHSNIMESEYFRALYQLKTYHEVIDEIYRSVQHVEAWQVGTSRIPSTCFCLLLKFMLMKLTLKQMKGLLECEDSAYVRAIGFMYLRYTCPPKDLWKWYRYIYIYMYIFIHICINQYASICIYIYIYIYTQV